MPIGFFTIGHDDAEAISASLQLLKRADHVVGFNVARPWKGVAFQHCDWVEPVAAKVSTVNTIVVEHGSFRGYNTDGIGITASIASVVGLYGKQVLILGAGGAAQTVPQCLAMEGIESLAVVDQDPARAERLVGVYRDLFAKRGARLDAVPADAVPPYVAAADVIINATPCGSLGYAESLPIQEELLQHIRRECVVAEMVYDPTYTPLLAAAAARGCVVRPGIHMLVEQACASYAAAFGELPDESEKGTMTFRSPS